MTFMREPGTLASASICALILVVSQESLLRARADEGFRT